MPKSLGPIRYSNQDKFAKAGRSSEELVAIILRQYSKLELLHRIHGVHGPLGYNCRHQNWSVIEVMIAFKGPHRTEHVVPSGNIKRAVDIEILLEEARLASVKSGVG